MSIPLGQRNLLFGILALHKNIISDDVFIAAMKAWADMKAKGLGQILREQYALSENHHALAEELVADHLARHGDDPHRSLAAVWLSGLARQGLDKIADPDVQAGLQLVATAPVEKPADARRPAVRINQESDRMADAPAQANSEGESATTARAGPRKRKAAAEARNAAAGKALPGWALVAGGAVVGGIVAVVALAIIVIAIVMVLKVARPEIDHEVEPVAKANAGVKPKKIARDPAPIEVPQAADLPMPPAKPAPKPAAVKPAVEMLRPPIGPVVVVPLEVPEPQKPPEAKRPDGPPDGFVPLFNGKDLTGWKPFAAFPGDWRVDKGILTGAADGRGMGRLYTEKPQPRDFHLRVEARIGEKTIGNVCFRCPDGTRFGYESALSTWAKANVDAGGLLVQSPTFGRSSSRLAPPPIPAGQWFTLELIASGNHLIVKVDGKTTTDTMDDTWLEAGHVGLSHHAGGPIEFRRIDIKALPPAPLVAQAPLAPTPGFLPLFNGKDLTGWKPYARSPGIWRVDKGVLVGTTADKRPGRMYTDKRQPRDFHLRIETRVSDQGWGSVLFRCPEETILGYEAPLNSTVGPVLKTGSLFAQVPGRRIDVARVLKTLVPPGEWFTLEIIALGTRLTVKVNGEITADLADQHHVPASEYLALVTAPFSRVEYRRIEIKELQGGPQAQPAVAADGFVPLFNGKDLAGWSPHAKYPGAWRVQDGILIGSAPVVGYLNTLRDDFKDFHLRVETRFNDAGVGGDGGVLFRSTLQLLGYETLINHPIKTTGNTYVRARGMLRDSGASSLPVPAGQWCTLDIIVLGNRLQIDVNGKRVGNLLDKNKEFTSGRITLRHSANATLEFRKVEIKELKADPALPVAADGFVPLFNGRDLTGWKAARPAAATWRVVDGVLTGSGPNLRELYTTRDDYGDFDLRLEARINGDGNTGVAFRYPYTPRDLVTTHRGGYLVNIDGRPGEFFKTGSLHVFEKTGVRGLAVREPLAVAGQWFTLLIVARGNFVSTYVNGQEGIRFLNPKTHLKGGRLALGFAPTNRQTVIEYRKIEIKEIKAVPPPPQPPPEGPLEDFVALYNGKDLAGWRVDGNDGWKVADGVLVGAGPDTALISKRGDYRSLIAKIELSASADIDAYFAFRENAGPDGKLVGLTSRITGDGTSVRAGYMGTDARKLESGNQQIHVKPDETFQMEFHITQDGARILGNGKMTGGLGYAPDTFLPGAIGLHIARGTLRVKKFEISAEAPLAAAPPPPAPMPPDPPPVRNVPVAGAFVAIFNGKDLAGWQAHAKRPGNWRVDNGVLIGSAPAGGSLYSTRGDYADFHLRAETRINDKGFGRLFVRAAYDPTRAPFKVLGYETLINQRPVGVKTGSLTATSMLGVSTTAAQEAPLPPGEWFMLDVIARGNQLSVLVNGKVVADFVDEKGQFARSGHIALHQDANAVIEFRKVEIKELTAKKPGPAADSGP